MQRETTQVTKLLNSDGVVATPGYCKRNLYEYNREAITAPKIRIKEWDFYQVSDGEYMVQINFANISIGAAGTVGIVNLKTGEKWDGIGLAVGTVNRYQMERNGDQPYEFRFSKGDFSMEIIVTETTRTLVAKCKNIDVKLVGEMLPNHESITIATPFDAPLNNRFFLTQKINCMPTSGYAKIGDKTIEFSPETAYMVMDWGRGVWPYRNTWYWGNGSTRLPDGKLFGFEITWGFGNQDNATETMLFYDGKAHKIGEVYLESDPEIGNKWMDKWVFKSKDGRFNLTMTPYFDHASGAIVVIGMKTHQVHGLWNGTVTLDDGTILEIKDMYAFCEKVHNAW